MLAVLDLVLDVLLSSLAHASFDSSKKIWAGYSHYSCFLSNDVCRKIWFPSSFRNFQAALSQVLEGTKLDTHLVATTINFNLSGQDHCEKGCWTLATVQWFFSLLARLWLDNEWRWKRRKKKANNIRMKHGFIRDSNTTIQTLGKRKEKIEEEKTHLVVSGK